MLQVLGLAFLFVLGQLCGIHIRAVEYLRRKQLVLVRYANN